jgi:acyl-homoserine lactone acylase PvdQ
LESFEPKVRELFEAYSSGINEFIKSSFALPIEFWILGLSMEPWTPLDSVIMFTYNMFMVSGGWQKEIAFDNVRHVLQDSRLLTYFFPHLSQNYFPDFLAPILSDE